MECEIESEFVEMSIDGVQYIVGCIYRPRAANIPLFLDKLDSIFSFIRERYTDCRLILHGDFNPLMPIAYKSARIDKISILKLEGIIKKISYERRDYESVDEKSLS